MSIAIRPELETKIRVRAEAEGLSIEAYLERFVLLTSRQRTNWKLWPSKGSIPVNRLGSDYPSGKGNIADSTNA